MSSTAPVLGCISAGVAAAGFAALRRRRPDALRRVRPYTVVTRRSSRTRRRRARGGEAVFGDLHRHDGAPVRAALRTLVDRLGRLFERRTDASLELTLRQAGFTDVGADDYRTRVVLQVLMFGAVGAAVGALVVHSGIAALGSDGVRRGVGASRGRGRLDCALQERRERIRLELYTVNQLLAMHVRTGAGPVQATQRIADRGSGAVVEELRAVLLCSRWRRRAGCVPPGRRADARTLGRPHLQALRRRRRTRRRSRRRPARVERRPPRGGGDPQDGDEATRRDARSHDRGAGPGDVAVHRRAAALDRLREPVMQAPHRARTGTRSRLWHRPGPDNEES